MQHNEEATAVVMKAEAEVEEAKTEVKKAKAKVEKAEAEVEEAKTEVKKVKAKVERLEEEWEKLPSGDNEKQAKVKEMLANAKEMWDKAKEMWVIAIGEKDKSLAEVARLQELAQKVESGTTTQWVFVVFFCLTPFDLQRPSGSVSLFRMRTR